MKTVVKKDQKLRVDRMLAIVSELTPEEEEDFKQFIKGFEFGYRLAKKDESAIKH